MEAAGRTLKTPSLKKESIDGLEFKPSTLDDSWGAQFETEMNVSPFGGFLSHRGTPSHHPFRDGIFPNKNHPAIGVPP